MKDKKQIDLKNLKSQGLEVLKKVAQYKLVAFLIFVALLYGFVWLKISSFSNSQPSSTSVSSQVQAARIPHIDQTTLNQLQSLQDNSVGVQVLFNQARNNPFFQ